MAQQQVWWLVSWLALFGAVALMTASGLVYWRGRRLAGRLDQLAGGAGAGGSDGGGGGAVAGMSWRLGGAGPAVRGPAWPGQAWLGRVLVWLSRLSAPVGGAAGSASRSNEAGWAEPGLGDPALRQRLAAAGWRGARAPWVFYAARTLLVLGLPVGVAMSLSHWAGAAPLPVLALACATAGVVGYVLPEAILGHLRVRRHEQIRTGLPDMVDLLLVCVESGLALDAAINRVAREVQRRSPALADEFHLAALEIRAGARRIDALHHLAARCDVDEVRNLISVLVQSERFGTSLGDALRVQADFMRVRRIQRAEELAAKVPLKILFPLILLIFPSLLVVILGPAMIRLPQFLGGQ